jgi:hypothetical protein
MYAYEMPGHEVHAHEMQAHEMHTHEMHAHEMYESENFDLFLSIPRRSRTPGQGGVGPSVAYGPPHLRT